MWAAFWCKRFWTGLFWPLSGPAPVTSGGFYRPAELEAASSYRKGVESAPAYLAMVESAPGYSKAVESAPAYRSTTESGGTYPGNHDERVQ